MFPQHATSLEHSLPSPNEFFRIQFEFITTPCTASAVLFLLPPPPNFAKTHTRLGRGRLEVALRDLIPPWGYTRCAGAACRGSELCRVGVLPGAGVGVPDGDGTPGRGAVPGQACRGWRRCARAASLPGRVVFPGRRREKTFFKKALRACIRKPSTRFRQDWWIRLSSARLFGGFSRCYFRRKER